MKILGFFKRIFVSILAFFGAFSAIGMLVVALLMWCGVIDCSKIFPESNEKKKDPDDIEPIVF